MLSKPLLKVNINKRLLKEIIFGCLDINTKDKHKDNGGK